MQVLTIDENGKLDISVRQGLMEAREIFLVITGANKRDMVEKLTVKMVRLVLNHRI